MLTCATHSTRDGAGQLIEFGDGLLAISEQPAVRTENHDPSFATALALDAGPGESNEAAHGRLASMSTRGRSWAISTATPSVLVRGCQARPPNTSTAITLEGPKIRVLDWIFALCRALILLANFVRFVGPPVSPPRRAFLTRLRSNSRSRHLSEQ